MTKLGSALQSGTQIIFSNFSSVHVSKKMKGPHDYEVLV